jgi:hypothetical protein
MSAFRSDVEHPRTWLPSVSSSGWFAAEAAATVRGRFSTVNRRAAALQPRVGQAPPRAVDRGASATPAGHNYRAGRRPARRDAAVSAANQLGWCGFRSARPGPPVAASLLWRRPAACSRHGRRPRPGGLVPARPTAVAVRVTGGGSAPYLCSHAPFAETLRRPSASVGANKAAMDISAKEVHEGRGRHPTAKEGHGRDEPRLIWRRVSGSSIAHRREQPPAVTTARYVSSHRRSPAPPFDPSDQAGRSLADLPVDSRQYLRAA